MTWLRIAALALTVLLAGPGAYGPTERPRDLGEAWLSAQRFTVALNAVRLQHQLPPVAYDGPLTGAAAEIVLDNADRLVLDHRDKFGGWHRDRLRNRGVSYGVSFEVLYWGTGESEAAALDGWLASSGHRRAVLDPRVRKVGYYQAWRIYRHDDGRTAWSQRYRWAAAVLSD